MVRIGLISDTHGLLRPEALEFLRNSDHIIHAGDIGKPEIIDTLSTLAPVTAVRGNNDHGPWTADLPLTARFRLDHGSVYVLHEIASLDSTVVGSDVRVVVSGHSHKPDARLHEDILFVNPGSAGPRRFKLPVSVAELRVNRNKISVRIRDLLNDAWLAEQCINPASRNLRL